MCVLVEATESEKGGGQIQMRSIHGFLPLSLLEYYATYSRINRRLLHQR